MKRKNIFYNISAAICALAGLSSCGDFLEVEPQNQIIFEKFWNEKGDVDNMIAGCYDELQSENVVSRMMVWGEFRSDNIAPGRNIDKDISLNNIMRENINASNGYTYWDKFYSVINRCNTTIKYAPKVAEKDPSFSKSELGADIAELSALRDLCYFYLIRSFRNVPYTTEAYIDDNQKMDLPALGFDAVLDSLITDLEGVKDQAVTTYPVTKVNYQTGRITKQAIEAMLCEMYLWKQDYQKCIEYADRIIAEKTLEAEQKSAENYSITDFTRTNGYPLIADQMQGYSNTFGNAYTSIFGQGNSSESIFEITYVKGDETKPSNHAANNLYGHYEGELVKGYGAPSAFLIAAKNNSLFASKGDKIIDSRYYSNIYNGDGIAKSLYSTFRIQFSSANPDYSYSGIYPKDQVRGNWVIYRLADIMLMKAEALACLMSNGTTLSEQDKTYGTMAFSLVNAINKRSVCETDKDLKDTLVASKYTTRDEVMNLVYDERQRELMFEGKRWFDLVRRSRRDGNTDYLVQKTLQKYTSNTSSIQVFLGKMDAIYWPYNVDELKVNHSINQNPAFGSGESGNYESTK